MKWQAVLLAIKRWEEPKASKISGVQIGFVAQFSHVRNLIERKRATFCIIKMF